MANPRKAVIQLTARHKSDDHLWFSFFHEAAHIVLHSKKGFFVDETNGGSDSELEEEANDWASDILVPRKEWQRFVDTSILNEGTVKAFADDQGIAPGIVVGRLQHLGLLPWSRLNDLKVRLEWESPEMGLGK